MKNYKETICTAFFSRTIKYRNKTAFVEIQEDGNERSIDYDNLSSLIKKLAFYLKVKNIQKGDAVILKSENSIEWPIYFFAINYLGAVCVPLDPKLPFEELKNVSLDCNAKACFLSKIQFQELNIPENNNYFEILSISQIYEFDEILDEPQYYNIACLIYTSGTTGNPKAVMLSNENYLSNIKSIMSLNIASSKDILLCLLPFYHSFPLMVNLLFASYIGATSIIIKSLRSDVLKDVIKRKKVTIIPAVPIFYKNIMDGIIRKIEESKVKLAFLNLYKFFSAMRRYFRVNFGRFFYRTIHREFGGALNLLISGGARLDREVFNFFYGLGFNLLEGYGLTEASPVVSFNLPNKEKAGSVGIPIPGVELKIAVEDGKVCEGEILVKGDNVMLGYWKNDELTKETIVDGYLKTGDIGYIDRDGYLFITGRKKEVIVLSNGKNIYPDDIEEVFKKNVVGIDDCVAIPYSVHGETHLAIVVKSSENKLEIEKRIIEFSKKLPDYKRPKKIFFTNIELPKTNLGKYKRTLIKELFLNEIEKQQISAKVIYDDPLINKVVSAISKVGNVKTPIYLESNLELDLSFDSLKKVELLVEIENVTGLNLPEGFMTDVVFVKDIVDKLKKYEDIDKKIQKDSTKSIEELILEMPSVEDIKQIESRKKITNLIFECLLFFFVRATAKIFYKIEVDGLEKLNKIEHPYILAPNHVSYLDGYILMSIIPFKLKRKLFFVSLVEFFEKTVLRVFKNSAGVIAFDYVLEPIRSIKASIYVLKNGYSLCIFPEGERSYDGNLMELKKGIAYIVKNTNVPVFPVFIKGTFDAWPRFRKWPRLFKNIYIKISDPIFWPSTGNYKEEEFLNKLKENLLSLSKAVEKK